MVGTVGCITIGTDGHYRHHLSNLRFQSDNLLLLVDELTLRDLQMSSCFAECREEIQLQSCLRAKTVLQVGILAFI